MKEDLFMEFISEIKGLDWEIAAKAKKRQDSLAKPPESLGKLESISIQMAGITGKVINRIEKGCVVIMSSDNGVVKEGVSSAPQSVTKAQTINFTRQVTGVGALAKTFNRRLLIVDVGINGYLPEELVSRHMEDFENNKIINRKIAMGTENIAVMPAMTREEALKAISVGIESAKMLKSKGYDIIGVGEMGIGNTTTSAAVLSGITACPVEISVGRGGGITDKSLYRKREIVQKTGLERSYADLTDILRSTGGFDICAMTGVFLGAAHERIPVIIDGYISAVAALVAYKFCPKAKDFFFGSHASEEKGYGFAMKAMDMQHMLDLNMRLGEGSGCIPAMEIIVAALGIMEHMATFEEARIDDEYLEEIRRGGCF